MYTSYGRQKFWQKTIQVTKVNKRNIGLLLVFSVLMIGCKKLVEVDPPINEVVGTEIYLNASTAASVLTGIYHDLSKGSFATGSTSISVVTGLSGDELNVFNNNEEFFYRLYSNNLSSTINTPDLWIQLYQYIFRCNSAVEGLSSSSTLSNSVKRQLRGEAVFMRALCHFYLINLYGDVPLITTTDYRITSQAFRVEKSKVYTQIITDLTEAEGLLNENYVGADVITPTIERIRPNKTTAKALLAKVYLYTQQWEKAEKEATEVIEEGDYELVANLNDVFLKNSREAIWQLQPVTPSYNTLDGSFFIIVPEIQPVVYLSGYLNDAFEENDNRRDNWVGITTIGADTFYYPNKYKVKLSDELSEYLIMFRLSEQYLIRAEARAHLTGKLTGENSAITDLNVIRGRAGLNTFQATSKDAVLNAILKERQVELFTELGARWFDLKRTENVNKVMSIVTPTKGGTWNTNKQQYPIPQEDINKNVNLKGHQNPGY